jgi:glycosyltransferase involved in cell wall biosynthesis
MNIVIINHYAGSPQHGMEYRPYYLAKEWIKLGHNVTIIAASESHLRQQQPTTTGKITREEIEGIHYLWLKTPSYQGNGIRRVLNMLSFAKSLFFLQKKDLGDFVPDLVIASSPHPFIIRGAKRIADTHKATLVFEVRDLWPLSLVELGGISPWHPFVMLMQNEENHAYKKSDYIISLLSNASKHMQQHGMSKNKFIYIPNGVVTNNEREPTYLSKETNTKIDKLKQKFDLLICFAGSHGIANALNYLLDAAALLSQQSIAFVLVGSGAEKKKLQQQTADQSLDHVFFFDPVSKQQIPAFLQKMDILYIGLQKQAIFNFGVSPNKLFDYMMAAKPIIHAIDAGDDIVKQSGCGISCQAENAEAIAGAINQLKKLTKKQQQRMGAKGYQYVLEHHNYSILAKYYLQMTDKSCA